MGATKTRLGISSPRMVIGENSLLIFLLEYLAWAGFFKKIPQRKLRDLLDLICAKDTTRFRDP